MRSNQLALPSKRVPEASLSTSQRDQVFRFEDRNGNAAVSNDSVPEECNNDYTARIKLFEVW